MEGKISIMLTDDHSLVRDGIKSLLEDVEGLEVIAEASNGQEALKIVGELHPDILIIDIRMPKMTGIEAVRELQKYSTHTRALILSMHDSEEYVLQSIEAGASGYLLKDTSKEEFVKAIMTIYQGEKYFSGDISQVLVNQYLKNSTGANPTTEPEVKSIVPDFLLTKRQKEILKLAVLGKTNKEIADTLGKSVRTIEAHRFSLMKKMGVRNLLEMSNKAKELNLV